MDPWLEHCDGLAGRVENAFEVALQAVARARARQEEANAVLQDAKDSLPEFFKLRAVLAGRTARMQDHGLRLARQMDLDAQATRRVVSELRSIIPRTPVDREATQVEGYALASMCGTLREELVRVADVRQCPIVDGEEYRRLERRIALPLIYGPFPQIVDPVRPVVPYPAVDEEAEAREGLQRFAQATAKFHPRAVAWVNLAKIVAAKMDTELAQMKTVEKWLDDIVAKYQRQQRIDTAQIAAARRERADYNVKGGGFYVRYVAGFLTLAKHLRAELAKFTDSQHCTLLDEAGWQAQMNVHREAARKLLQAHQAQAKLNNIYTAAQRRAG